MYKTYIRIIQEVPRESYYTLKYAQEKLDHEYRKSRYEKMQMEHAEMKNTIYEMKYALYVGSDRLNEGE